MKYLSVFATEHAYAAAKLDGTFARPHVSLVEETSSVKFDQVLIAPGVGPEIDPDNPEHNFGEDIGKEGQL